MNDYHLIHTKYKILFVKIAFSFQHITFTSAFAFIDKIGIIIVSVVYSSKPSFVVGCSTKDNPQNLTHKTRILVSFYEFYQVSEQ